MTNIPNTNTNPTAEPKLKLDYGTKDTIIFALEETIANTRHRLDLRMNDYNWQNYYEAADGDTVFPDTVALLHGLMSDFCILIYTTRPERYRQLTIDWLRRQNLYPDGLLMRGAHYSGKDDEIKVALIMREFNNISSEAINSVVAVFDNDARLAVALRNLGFTVFSKG